MTETSAEKNFEKILKTVTKHPEATAFSMSRVPKKEVDAFKDYADKHFLGDYGMAFKILVDDYIIGPDKLAHIYNAIGELQNEIQKLNSAVFKDKLITKHRRMDGTVVDRGGKDGTEQPGQV